MREGSEKVSGQVSLFYCRSNNYINNPSTKTSSQERVHMVGTLEEIIDDDHAIISTASGPESYVSIMSFVDKYRIEPGCSVLLNHKNKAVVGLLEDDTDPLVSVMKLDKAPTESYADIGGLENQIQEIKVLFLLPLYIRVIMVLLSLRNPSNSP